MMIPQNIDNRNGYQKLMDANPGIFVAQKMDMLEMVTGCEMPNKYYVSTFVPDQSGTNAQGGPQQAKGPYVPRVPKGLPFFKCKEKSGFCERMCCRGPARPLDIDVMHESPSVIIMTSAYKIYCLCLNI